MISVSNIERFATHDGPGIRTTIFLKGCSLHCPWCANPETWDVHPVLMHKENKCVRCHSCLKACTKQAISFQPEFTLNRNVCDECALCVDACLLEALEISGKWMDIEEIVEEVQKDDQYYQKSNGGVTLSGGEPLFQFDEVFLLICTLHERGYHLALETTGNYPLEHLKKVEPYIDLFLMDCKHLEPEKLQKITGANPKFVQDSFTYLSQHCPEKVIVRMPVIWNFNEDQIEKTIDQASRLGFSEVDLLPFHSLGKNKWENLNKVYPYASYPMMKKETLNAFVAYGKTKNIYVKIGG